MYLTIRKKFTKITAEPSLTENRQTEAAKENEILNAELVQAKLMCKNLKETNKILENKIKVTEVELVSIREKQKKALDVKQDEIKVLKDVIKNSNTEKSSIRDELSQSKKVAKKKEKEIYSLES